MPTDSSATPAAGAEGTRGGDHSATHLVTTAMIDAAMDEAGSGWFPHAGSLEDRRWLMSQAIAAALYTVPPPPDAPAPTPEAMAAVEFRSFDPHETTRSGQDKIDEIVAERVTAHLEDMDGSTAYLGISAADGHLWQVYVHATKGDAVARAFRVLKDVSPRKKQVYTMIGHEPFDVCMDRIRKVIASGGEPYAQPFIKLNSLTKEPAIRHNWTPLLLRQVQRWVNRHLWRTVRFEDYDASVKSSRLRRAA